MSRRLSLIVVVAACRREPIASCDADLTGVWIAPAGERWMMLDLGASLEAYPMAPDAPASRMTDVVAAPRAIGLARTPRGLAGEVRRRYMRRADTCDARTPIHVDACRDDTLELVTADIVAPLAFAPCRWPMAAPARVERWHRE